MFKIIKNHLYLLQLENYDLPRFLKVVFLRPFPKTKPRQELVWTPKLIVVFILALGFVFSVAWGNLLYYGFRWTGILLSVIYTLAFINLFPLVLVLALLVVKPFDLVARTMILTRAKTKLAKVPNLKIIGITGSYGKTTMKEILATVLSQRFQVLKTPENINTPRGVARRIQSELTESTEIFIVEMGAYHRGDIRSFCNLTRPDIVILTGINEQHIERFGSLDNIIKAKFEIIENAKGQALTLLNGENELICQNYKKFNVENKKIVFYSKESPYPNPLNKRLLGEYASGMINASVIIGRELGMSRDEIHRGIENLKPIPHRLELIENPNGVTVIDDSYNGNPDGVDEAIKVLSKFSNRRKIYITPGLAELAERSRDIHVKIGEKLSEVADLVILVRNRVTPFIAEGLKRRDFADNKILWYETALQAHEDLGNILKSGDVVMFQNDWPDNYI